MPVYLSIHLNICNYLSVNYLSIYLKITSNCPGFEARTMILSLVLTLSIYLSIHLYSIYLCNYLSIYIFTSTGFDARTMILSLVLTLSIYLSIQLYSIYAICYLSIYLHIYLKLSWVLGAYDDSITSPNTIHLSFHPSILYLSM